MTDPQDPLGEAVKLGRMQAGFPKRAPFARAIRVDDSTLQIIEGTRAGSASDEMIEYVTMALGWPAGVWRDVQAGKATPPRSVFAGPGANLTGQEVAARRSALGWTHRKLAEAARVSEAVLADWEAGEPIPPSKRAELEAVLSAQSSSSGDPIRDASDLTLLAELMRRAAARR